MNDALRLWAQFRASSCRVHFDGSTIRLDGRLLAVWNPKREVLALALDPALGLSEARTAALVEQAGRRDPRELCALLDAHLASLVEPG